MGIQQIGREDTDWIALVQDEDKRGGEHVKAVMNLWVPQNAENFLTS